MDQNNPNDVIENDPEQQRLDFEQIVDQVVQNVLPLVEQRRQLRQQLQSQGMPNGAFQELQGRLLNVQERIQQQRQQILQQFLRLNQQERQQLRQQFRQYFQQQLQQPVIGLTTARIGRFEHFTANESMVGEKCIVCHDDLEADTEMVRLDCHISHYFCRRCIYKWFEDHNTCPTCRCVFN